MTVAYHQDSEAILGTTTRAFDERWAKKNSRPWAPGALRYHCYKIDVPPALQLKSPKASGSFSAANTGQCHVHIADPIACDRIPAPGLLCPQSKVLPAMDSLSKTRPLLGSLAICWLVPTGRPTARASFKPSIARPAMMAGSLTTRSSLSKSARTSTSVVVPSRVSRSWDPKAPPMILHAPFGTSGMSSQRQALSASVIGLL